MDTAITTATQSVKSAKKSKASKDVPRPVHTIRQRAVMASIWRRQTPTGFSYLDFSLSRAWKSTSSGRSGYSQNFFAQNRDDLCAVIAKVSEWIRENEEAEMATPD